MHWRAKGVLQKVLGHVPGGERAHYELQRRFGPNYEKLRDVWSDEEASHE